ncbi:hypothetical protein [Thermococcus waiotapuensis]|uniref:Uncharacterized protein n=1 Tax=Thermococcus waiotapuensis TaxID=90909 RepID=A0AAE4NX17_9EURY|nr:hypothetical protein [Thermococcus waiotapuensis]MDV3103996.1 hypothetical protein [Thermococcus waiotapuensis]
MKWLGRRLKNDRGVVALSVLSPMIVYFGMWRKVTSYWPTNLEGFERLLPCNLTQQALPKITEGSQLLFSRVSDAQAKALGETLIWGLLAVFFLAGTFVVYTLGRAVSSEDFINIAVLRGSKGGALLEYLKVFVLYSLYISVTLAPLLAFMFKAYAVDIHARGLVSLLVVIFGVALWGVAVALLTISLLRDSPSAIISLFGIILGVMAGGKIAEVLLPYHSLFIWILSDFKIALSPYSSAGILLNPLFIAGAYFIFERRDFG